MSYDRFVFIAVFLLTFACGLAVTFIAIALPDPTEIQVEVVRTLNNAFVIGSSTIIALVVGGTLANNKTR